MISEKINPFHNLKSSMDRFIEKVGSGSQTLYRHLKSSMDRFIGTKSHFKPSRMLPGIPLTESQMLETTLPMELKAPSKKFHTI